MGALRFYISFHASFKKLSLFFKVTISSKPKFYQMNLRKITSKLAYNFT